jgi:F-type H+-transporting ATPase subunit epsilon
MSAAAFSLVLLDGQQVVRIDDVVSLVAEDASGQFGVQPGHAAMLTVLEPGLFRYRRSGQPQWTYGASVGGLLSCMAETSRSEVRIVSRRFLQGAQAESLQAQLDELLQRESSLRLTSREGQARVDLAFYKRIQELAQTRR